MIVIHTGVLPEEVTQGQPELRYPKDYPNIRLEIRKALSAGQDCDVYVKHRACDNWFWDLSDYGGATVINDGLRERLRKKLKLVALPPDLDSHPDWIVTLGLLELPIPQKLDTDVWTWILTEKLGSSWSQSEPSFNHLGSIVEWHIRNPTMPNAVPNALRQRQRLAKEQWISEAKGELKSAYESFFDNPTKNSILLASWQNLEKYYPDDLERWLKEDGWYAPSLTWLAFRLPPLELSADIRAELSPKVRAYWNGKLGRGEYDLDRVLLQMSGMLLGEIEAIEDCMDRELISVNRLQVEKIRMKFANLPNAASIMETISAQVPPEEITEPNPAWGEDAWVSWAVNQYIPYKKWLIDHGRDSSVVSKYCLLYEEWLFVSYPTFIQRVDNLVYASFKQVEPLVRNGTTVIWVLVDNLPLFWHDVLSKVLSERGFLRPTPPVYLFSMIPSETSICRPSILVGKLPHQARNMNVEQAFAQEWKKRGITARISHSTEELAKHATEGGDLFLLVYNNLDYLAHQPDHELTNREETARFHIGCLSQELHEVMKQVAEVRAVKLVISSDHGSTKILSGAQNLTIPSSAQVDEALKQHSRFVRLTHFQSLNPLEWFFLEGDTFGLPENYAVVKGNRYVAARPLGYTHGGMSPEETITALSVWQLGQIPTEVELSVFHLSPPIVRGRPQQLTITVRNPFSFDVIKLSIYLPSIGAHFEVDKVLAQTEVALGPIEIRLPAKYPVSNGVCTVDMVVAYEVAGCMKQQTKPALQVKIRELFRSMLDNIETMP